MMERLNMDDVLLPHEPGFMVRPDKPDSTKIPGLADIHIEEIGPHTNARLRYGDHEPILNVWVSDNPPSTEMIWAWKSNGVKYRAYMCLVTPGYAKRNGFKSVVADEPKISRVEELKP